MKNCGYPFINVLFIQKYVPSTGVILLIFLCFLHIFAKSELDNFTIDFLYDSEK